MLPVKTPPLNQTWTVSKFRFKSASFIFCRVQVTPPLNSHDFIALPLVNTANYLVIMEYVRWWGGIGR